MIWLNKINAYIYVLIYQVAVDVYSTTRSLWINMSSIVQKDY